MEETTIVALLARGETQATITTYMAKEFDRHVASSTVALVKKRNKDNLEMLKQKVTEKNYVDALNIKNKANDRLSERLDADTKATKLFDSLHQKFEDGDITFQEYQNGLKLIPKSFFVSTGELVAVSKEMNTQSRGEESPPTQSIDPAQLAKAIQEGDTLTLNQLVFKRNVEPGQTT